MSQNNHSCRCTFCGWVDPEEMFHYETPGKSAVCTACAQGLLCTTIPEAVEQGDDNYLSGQPRLVRKSTGEKLYPDLIQALREFRFAMDSISKAINEIESALDSQKS